MNDFDINAYIKKCKKYISFYYRYLFRLMFMCLIAGLAPVPFKWRPYLINGLMVLGVIWLLLKGYVQYKILRCPYCNEPFSRERWLSNVPYKCKHCDRVIDSDAADVHKI